MMTKPKPNDDGGETSLSIPAETTAATTTTDDREKELERRLAMLGTGESDANEAETTEAETESMTATATATATDSNNLISFDAPPAPVVESKPEPVAVAPKPTVTKPNKSALLARIMAAQERAKQAQMKQAAPTVVAPPPIQQQSTTVLPAPAQMTINAEQEKEKMMKALSGVVDVAMEKQSKTKDDNDTMSFKPPSIPPPQFNMNMDTTMNMAPPTTAPPAPAMTMTMAPPPVMMAPPIMAPPAPAAPAVTAPPPPSFDIFEQQQMKEERQQQQLQVPLPPPPPPAFGTIENDLLGFPGVQAPSAPPPEDTSIANLDGMTPMAPPPPTYTDTTDIGMMDDELFMHDENGNKLSPEERRKMMEEQRAIMEQIQKQAIENKASEAAVRANAFETRMAGNGPPITSTMNSTSIRQETDDVDVSNIDMEEQRKILEEIERNARGGGAGAAYQSPAAVQSSSNRMVDIGQEAAQMEEDRKLAERLQNELNAEGVNDYPANRSRTAGASSAAAASGTEGGGWWDSMLATMGVSDAPPSNGSAEINVSRPPGSSRPTSSQRALHSSSSNDYDSDPRAARVAESKPLFSCVVDSVSHAASAAAAGVSQMTYGDDEEVHGIDTTSFLAVPNVGDDRGPSGSYTAYGDDR